MTINTKLTTEGEAFIREVCRTKTNLLSGKFKTPLPYADPPVSPTKIWECDIINPLNTTKKITTHDELASALIYWYNKYGEDFKIDPNVMAAQAYVESNFIMWAYVQSGRTSDGKIIGSTASGLCQFIMETVYDTIIRNLGEPKSPETLADIDKIVTPNMRNGLAKNSYLVRSDNPNDARFNRAFLHQNVINNPEIMIKSQFRYMKMIADRTNNLTSSTLFCYNRGPAFAAKTYTATIEKCRNSKNYSKEYYVEGVDYVLKTFSVLGDKDNKISLTGKRGGFKPKGIYFGYDHLFLIKDDKNNVSNQLQYINPNFDVFVANVAESKIFNIDGGFESNAVTQELSKNPNYRFIYFPESEYTREITRKKQIVLHHTVSGDNVAGDVYYWQNKGEKIGTSFIVARKGQIYQLFLTDYWAYHLGLRTNNNLSLNKNSIGIEIDSWGGLLELDGFWYPARTNGDIQKLVPDTRSKPIENIVEYKAPEYPNGYHGFFAFEKYTNEQIESVRQTILAIKKSFPDIELRYVNDVYGGNMWGTFNTTTNSWEVDTNAMAGKTGIWTHTSFRTDKSDCHPQPELIQMLKSLA